MSHSRVLSKDRMPDQLTTERTLIRLTTAEDLDQFHSWPSYPVPYNHMNLTGAAAWGSGKRYWWEQIDDPDRCHYTIIHKTSNKIIGIHALVNIDWQQSIVGDMGNRIHPDFCNQGYGLETTRTIWDAVLKLGMKTLRLSVLSWNERAIRNYQNCGMTIKSDVWDKYDGALEDLEHPLLKQNKDHFRQEDGICMVRLYVMEKTIIT